MPDKLEDGGDAPSRALPKVPTGVDGLDNILHGGLPEGQVTLFTGGAGAGKSVLALEFLYRGALAGRPGIFVTFEESADRIRRNARTLGWDLDALEKSGQLFIMHAEVPRDMVLAGEFDIGGLLAILGGKTDELGARSVVIDAVDVLMRVFRDRAREHNEFHVLNDWLRKRLLTAALTVKSTEEGAIQYPFLDFMADCVIRLDQRVDGQITTRRLRVLKYRGSSYAGNECPFMIEENTAGGGVVVMPVPSLALSQRPLERRLATGSSALDEVLGGGYWRGSCVVIAGSSGTGKTTLACTFTAAACERGEKVLYVSFEDSDVALVHAMRSPGIDLSTHRNENRLRLLAVMPESRGVEQHLHRIYREMAFFAADHLVIDAISACHRMGSEQAAFDFQVRLLIHCRSAGITCLFTDQMYKDVARQDASGIGIASLVDTLVHLRLTPSNGTMERRLLVLKSRGSNHSLHEHPFAITDNGIHLVEWPTGAATPPSPLRGPSPVKEETQ